MKAKISRNKLEKVVTKWLDQSYGNLRPFTPKEEVNSVYLFDPSGSIIFAYMKQDKSLFIRGSLFSFMYGLFYLDYTNYLSKDIIKKWLLERYGLTITGPIDLFNHRLSIIGEIEEDIKALFKVGEE